MSTRTRRGPIRGLAGHQRSHATVSTPAPASPALRPLPRVEHQAGQDMAGRKVLVVDDNIRSLFALSALLRRVRVEVLSAERGQRGIDLLEQTPDIDLALCGH